MNVAPRVALPGAKDSRPTSSEADEQAAAREKESRKVQLNIQDQFYFNRKTEAKHPADCNDKPSVVDKGGSASRDGSRDKDTAAAAVGFGAAKKRKTQNPVPKVDALRAFVTTYMMEASLETARWSDFEEALAKQFGGRLSDKECARARHIAEKALLERVQGGHSERDCEAASGNNEVSEAATENLKPEQVEQDLQAQPSVDCNAEAKHPVDRKHKEKVMRRTRAGQLPRGRGVRYGVGSGRRRRAERGCRGGRRRAAKESGEVRPSPHGGGCVQACGLQLATVPGREPGARGYR
jgi:hypothetical protein